MPNANVEYLREHGPASGDALPNTRVSVSDRLAGVWKFRVNVRSGSSRGENTTPNHVNAVYYLRDEHDTETVLEAFFAVNPAFRPDDDRQRKAFKQTLTGEWKDALDAVVGGEQ